MPRTLHTYIVTPSLRKTAAAAGVGYNLRWSWDHATRELFISLDADLWNQSNHNPAKLLSLLRKSDWKN